MSFIIMYNYAIVIYILQSACHYIILQVLVWKWHFDTVRYCHLLSIWYVFIVDVIFFFFFILRMIRYMLIYI